MSRTGVRLSGGRFGGRRLTVPATARPTEGRVREALMSMWGEKVVDARVLDLFAGSGAVGFEALGRGAVWLTAIDREPAAIRELRANRTRLGAEASSEVLRLGLPAGLRRGPTEPYDLVFADPPYRFERYGELLVLLERWLAPLGDLAIEHAPSTELETTASLHLIDRRTWGDTAISFFHRSEVVEPVTRLDPLTLLP
ncbi:MAG: 16S rRNA (guanine(966)-N(2))-methyltransferase RsmD [Acidobacteriota bacterium]